MRAAYQLSRTSLPCLEAVFVVRGLDTNPTIAAFLVFPLLRLCFPSMVVYALAPPS